MNEDQKNIVSSTYKITEDNKTLSESETHTEGNKDTREIKETLMKEYEAQEAMDRGTEDTEQMLTEESENQEATQHALEQPKEPTVQDLILFLDTCDKLLEQLLLVEPNVDVREAVISLLNKIKSRYQEVYNKKVHDDLHNGHLTHVQEKGNLVEAKEDVNGNSVNLSSEQEDTDFEGFEQVMEKTKVVAGAPPATLGGQLTLEGGEEC